MSGPSPSGEMNPAFSIAIIRIVTVLRGIVVVLAIVGRAMALLQVTAAAAAASVVEMVGSCLLSWKIRGHALLSRMLVTAIIMMAVMTVELTVGFPKRRRQQKQVHARSKFCVFWIAQEASILTGVQSYTCRVFFFMF